MHFFLFSSGFRVNPKLLSKFSLPNFSVMSNHVAHTTQQVEEAKPQDKVHWLLIGQS